MNKEITKALKEFYNIVEEADIFWILSGSASLIIQGIDIEVNDIDILTDKEGAQKLDALLAVKCSKKLQYSVSDKYKSYFGIYNFDKVKIEVMGEFQYLLKNGNWSQRNQTHEFFVKEFEGMNLPMLSLEQELVEYENVGDIMKVKKIRGF